VRDIAYHNLGEACLPEVIFSKEILLNRRVQGMVMRRVL
jgi:hypothetical protein